MVSRVVESGLPLIYLNMVGGRDDQVFDGDSFALNADGSLVLQMPMFTEAINVILKRQSDGWVMRKVTKPLFPIASGLSRDSCRAERLLRENWI